MHSVACAHRMRLGVAGLLLSVAALASLPAVSVSNTYHPPASCGWTSTSFIASSLGIPASHPLAGGTPGIEDCAWSLWNPEKPGWGKLTLQYVEEGSWSESTMQGYAQQNNCRFGVIGGLGEAADDAICHDNHAKNPNQEAMDVEVGPDPGGINDVYLSVIEYPYIKPHTRTVLYRPLSHETAGLEAIARRMMKNF
jgi:hypothetical protein